MTKEILITGGRVIDPARGIDKTEDLLIVGDKIASPQTANQENELSVLRADGCIVLPGLIDFHSHVFFGGADNSIPPDAGMLPNGVTTVVDGGTAGTANYEIFHKSVIANSIVRIKSFLSVSPSGQSTTKYNENQDPQYYDQDKMERLFSKYPEELLGLKLRQSKDVVGELGLTPLQTALKIAGRLNCRVAVHTTNPPIGTNELVQLFRPGDIFTHVYHGTGSTIIGHDGRVLPAVKSARQRGVIFDAANGKSHFSFKTAEAAIKDGFLPDVISSDLTWLTMFDQPVFGLPWLMAKYLALGVNLSDVVARCTAIPAALMGMSGKIGTLSPGACADVAIFRIINHPCEFADAKGETRPGQQLLLPQATFRAGRLVFRQLNF